MPNLASSPGRSHNNPMVRPRAWRRCRACHTQRLRTRQPYSDVVDPRHEIEKIDLQVDACCVLREPVDRLSSCPSVGVGDECAKIREDPEPEVEIRQFFPAFVMEPYSERLAAVDDAVARFVFVQELQTTESGFSCAPPLRDRTEIQ